MWARQKHFLLVLLNGLEHQKRKKVHHAPRDRYIFLSDGCRGHGIHLNCQLSHLFNSYKFNSIIRSIFHFFFCLLNISIQFASNYQFIRWINPRKSRWMKSPKKGGGAEGGASWFFFLVVVASVGTLRASGPISVGFLVFFSACHPLWNTQQPPTIQPQEAATGAGIKTHISY